MAQVKVSSKYQIVIPREVRKALDIRKGQTVSVIPMGNVIEIVPDRDISEMQGIFPDLTLDGIRDESDGRED
jgi:AbrB family looped-hinge helix DNA binding protein